MQHYLLDFLTIFLLLVKNASHGDSLYLSTEDLIEGIKCTTDSCDEVKKYIQDNLSRGELDTCADPTREYCNRTITDGKQNLAEKKAAEVKNRRERIFMDVTWWRNHSSKFIVDVGNQFMRCMSSDDNRQYLMNVVTKYLQRTNQLVVERALQDKVVHLAPQLLLTESQMQQQVSSMEKFQLCHYNNERRFPRIIDRLYHDKYYMHTAVIHGISFLKLVHGRIKSIIGSEGQPLDDSSRTAQEFFSNLEGVKFRPTFSKDVVDDSLLERMYRNEEEPLEGFARKNPPEPSSALPLYPDAIWYNEQVKTIYIGPSFFEPPLFHKDLPVVWNLAGLIKVCYAIFAQAPKHVREKFIQVYLAIDKEPGTRKTYLAWLSSFIEKLAGPITVTPELEESMFTELMIQAGIKIFTIKYPESKVDIETAESLAIFRGMNDHCVVKPASSAEITSYHESTGFIFPTFFIYSYHAERIENCSLTPEPWFSST